MITNLLLQTLEKRTNLGYSLIRVTIKVYRSHSLNHLFRIPSRVSPLRKRNKASLAESGLRQALLLQIA